TAPTNAPEPLPMGAWISSSPRAVSMVAAGRIRTAFVRSAPTPSRDIDFFSSRGRSRPNPIDYRVREQAGHADQAPRDLQHAIHRLRARDLGGRQHRLGPALHL